MIISKTKAVLMVRGCRNPDPDGLSFSGCIGNACKLVQFMTGFPGSTGRVDLGTATDTQDASGVS